MARRKDYVTGEVLPKAGDREVALQLAGEQEAAEDARAEVAEELGKLDEHEDGDFFRGLDELRSQSGVAFEVQKLGDRGFYFCREYPAASFSKQKVQQDFGGGEYRVRVKGQGGRYVPGGGKLLIAEPAVAEDFNRSSQGAQPQLMPRYEPAPSSDWMDKLTKLAPLAAFVPVFQEVVRGFFSGRAEKSDLGEMVKAMLALKALNGEQAKPTSPITQLTELQSLIKMVQDMQPEAPDPTGSTWVDLIRDVTKNLSPALAMMASRLPGFPGAGLLSSTTTVSSAPASRQTLVDGAPSEASLPATQPVNTSGSSDMSLLSLLPWLRATLEQLLLQAARDKDPELYAEVVWDNIPENADKKEVFELIAQPNCIDNLVGLDERVNAHREWFTEFRNALLIEMRRDPAVKSMVPVPNRVPTPDVTGGDDPE